MSSVVVMVMSLGNELADLVDCYEGLVIRDCSVSHFWEGFENLDGEILLLWLADIYPGCLDYSSA